MKKTAVKSAMQKTQGKKPLIGFIGQGFIGKNYALDFERRGYEVIRYSKEEPHIQNKERIAECDIVFIAVPTPTTSAGFDDSIVREAITHVGKGKSVVIKSTILPGTVESLQKANPYIFVMHSPEFLREVTAEYDAAHPERNIIGIPKMTPTFMEKADAVLAILPTAPYTLICTSREAELIKYAGNCFLYTKVIFMNMLYDLAQGLDCDYKILAEALSKDSRIGTSHLNPIHQSGRGAGGHCFIKDFAAFEKLYAKFVDDESGTNVLTALERKNIELLIKTKKDLNLLEGVYGGSKGVKAKLKKSQK